MATTVEVDEQRADHSDPRRGNSLVSGAPAAARGRARSSCSPGIVVGWFVLASGKRKEAVRGPEPQPGPSGSRGGQPSAGLQRAAAADHHVQGTDAASEAVITLNQVRMVNGQSELAAVGLRDFLATKPAPKY